MSNKLLAFASALLFSCSVSADQPAALFGPEFTFTYDGEVPGPIRTAYIDHVHHHLVTNQPMGAKFTRAGKDQPRFISPNGWWFEITTNPGVIEIKMSPMTVEDYARYSSDIEDAIFVSARMVGLSVWDYLGGGHLNFGIEIFGDDLRLARNFVADFWSHNELSMGILSYDNNNALPFAIMDPEEHERVRELLRAVDEGRFESSNMGIRAFFAAVDKIPWSGKSRFYDEGHGKHHDLNLYHAGRVEIRSVRPQPDMKTWVNQIKLIQARVDYLRTIDRPLPLEFRVPVNEVWVTAPEHLSNRYVPPVDPIKALASFHRYVRESGLKWKDHRGYVWPPWRHDGTLAKYEVSEEFKALEREAYLGVPVYKACELRIGK